MPLPEGRGEDMAKKKKHHRHKSKGLKTKNGGPGKSTVNWAAFR